MKDILNKIALATYSLIFDILIYRPKLICNYYYYITILTVRENKLV